MLNIKIFFSNIKDKQFQRNLFIIFIIFLSNLYYSYCDGRGNLDLVDLVYDLTISIKEENIFNNIIKFDNKKYKSGNTAINKKGDLILEYFENNEISSSRLFYGLNKEGRYFFSNESSYTKEIYINNDEINNGNGYNNINSLNLFISLKNDMNNDNEYLFSINLYDFSVELFNFNNEHNNHIILNFNNFFNINENSYNFLYDYVLIELKNEPTYFIAIIPNDKIQEDMLNTIFIKKFIFTSFDNEAYEVKKSITYSGYINTKIINVFYMDDNLNLVVLECVKNEANNIFTYTFKFYNHNLELLNELNEIGSNNLFSLSFQEKELLYFKSLYLGM